MIDLHCPRILGTAVAGAFLLTACPDPIELEDGDSTTSGSSAGSATGTSSSSSTVDPDGGTSSTTAPDPGTSDDSGTTGSGIDDPGCPACMVLAVGLEEGRGIAVDLDYVYFTDQSRGTVERVHKGGGEGSVLASEQDTPYGVAVSDQHVYWSNFYAAGSIQRAPLAGGPPTLVGTGSYPRTVAVVGDQVYWGTFSDDSGAVMRVPTALDQMPSELAYVLGGVADLVVQGDRVFFTAHTNSSGAGFIEPPPKGSPVGSVFATPPGGGPIDPFDVEQIASNQAEPWGIALTGDTLLWINGMGEASNDARSVISMATAGGPTQALASGQGNPWDIAVDDQYAYWTDFTEVKATPLAGGAEIVLAEQQNTARSIAVDEQWVYWITRERVLQRPKP